MCSNNKQLIMFKKKMKKNQQKYNKKAKKTSGRLTIRDLV